MARVRQKRQGDGRLRPRLTVGQILLWADAHHWRTGKWPKQDSGKIWGSNGETWHAVQGSLQAGCRGLPGGMTLAQLLAKHRDVPNWKASPRLTIKQILKWADAHFRRTGRWPHSRTGPIHGVRNMDWMYVATALTKGTRGMPGGTSLARLLEKHRGVINYQAQPRLTIRQILHWAEAHRKRTGRWPHQHSGRIPGTQYETWKRINAALIHGVRGLRPGSSLPKLLAARLGVRHRQYPPPLSERQILKWADAHRRRTGEWPTSDSGPIREVPGESWRAVSEALDEGTRGLCGGSSLARLLYERRGVIGGFWRPRLTRQLIIEWAIAHHARRGRWPNCKSGEIAESPDQTWGALDQALKLGYRGLPGGSSLSKLLKMRSRPSR